MHFLIHMFEEFAVIGVSLCRILQLHVCVELHIWPKWVIVRIFVIEFCNTLILDVAWFAFVMILHRSRLMSVWWKWSTNVNNVRITWCLMYTLHKQDMLRTKEEIHTLARMMCWCWRHLMDWPKMPFVMQIKEWNQVRVWNPNTRERIHDYFN